MTTTIVARIAMAICVAGAIPGCDSNSNIPDTFDVTYKVAFDASVLTANVTNSYHPLVPGTTSRFEGQMESGLESTVTEVLNDTRVVAGVAARAVRDRVYLDGELVEDTIDWYAQDADGNVWYLGEDSKEYRNGVVVSTAGSWETGVKGALAGIIMPAVPAVGQAYYQEFAKDEAEDRARIISIGENVTVVAGAYTNCLKTEETTPLEPDVLEHKYYCKGVGLVLEENPADGTRSELQPVR